MFKKSIKAGSAYGQPRLNPKYIFSAKEALLWACIILCVLLFMDGGAMAASTIPPEGSSFTIDRDMEFENAGNLRYNVISGKYSPAGAPYNLGLLNTRIFANEIDLEQLKLNAAASSISSASVLRINQSTLSDSSLTAAQNVVFSGKLSAISGENIITSTGRDIYLGYGTEERSGGILTLEAGGEIAANNGFNATNVHADYLTIYSDMNLMGGAFVSRNYTNGKHYASVVYGGMTLLDMDSTIGEINVMGAVNVEGGAFDAKTAIFYNTASFVDAKTDIETFSSMGLYVEKGRLNLGVGNSVLNTIAGDLAMGDAESELGNIKVTGRTRISGGSLKAAALDLQAVELDQADANIGSLSSRDFTASGGSLNVGVGNEHLNRIDGNLILDNVKGGFGHVEVSGDTAVKGGSFAARELLTGYVALDGSDSSIGTLNAKELMARGGRLKIGVGDSALSELDGNLLLENVEAEIGNLKAAGGAGITGGSLKAAALDLQAVELDQADADIGSLSSRDFTASGGSLNVGVGNEHLNRIDGNLILDNVKGGFGHVEVSGRTAVAGGTFRASALQTGPAAFDSVVADIESLSLNGSLHLSNGAVMNVGGSVAGDHGVYMENSRFNVNGDFSAADFSMTGSALFASGNVDIGSPEFQMASSAISGSSATMADLSSIGQNFIEAANDITTGRIHVKSGRLLLYSDAEAGRISADNLHLSAGAGASFQAYAATVGSIRGTGHLDAHNLRVNRDLTLAGGNLYLSGDNVIGRNLDLSYVNAWVDNLAVRGDAVISASTVTGKSLELENGATLDKSSRVELQSLRTEKDIRLLDNAEIIAGDISLGSGLLSLDGSSGPRVVVAVRDFENGDLTVDANSLLSIGANTPDWLHMGMDGHRASAALGLWTPFVLGDGASAAVGAGSLSRRNGGFVRNEVFFGSNSLLITDANVASRYGDGAISASSPAVANVEPGAKLHILHAQKDGLYRVLGNNIDVRYQGDAWQNDNVKTDSILVKLERLGGDRLGWFQAKTPGASTVLPGLDPGLGDSVDDSMNGGLIPPEPDKVPTPPSGNHPVQPTPDKPVQPAPDKPSQPTPDKPVQPTPDKPSQPTPDKPVQPTPDKPSQPTPDKPSQPTPDKPGTPDNPGKPDEPDTPEEPGDPDKPGTSEPDEPEGPEEPEEDEWRPYPVYTPGQLFLSRATNFWILGHDPRLAARTIESAARIFALGAVPEMTFAANQAAAAAMAQRTGGRSDTGLQAMNSNGELLENGENKTGFAMWATPLYKSVNGYSLTSGNWDVDVSGALGGIAIGADYTCENAMRLGISLNIGGGYARGGGELAETANNMSFWGIGAYSSWRKENFEVAADAAFTSTYNKLKQELPADMGMEDLKSDITAWALSAGLEFAYRIPTPFVDIRPHAGARYTYVHNDPYDVDSGGTVLEGKARGQNLWTFPAGVGFEKKLNFVNGWHFRPQIDLAVVPAAGDRKVWSETRFTGTNLWTSMRDQFMDDISYRGTLGLDFYTDNISLGINYSIQTGVKNNSQTVMGMFAYTF